jgi:hypothetical protein
VLHVIPDCMPGADAAFYEYACVMNLENWEFVPESMRSDKIFDRMLASPWNGTAAIPARIPPLVLQLGPREDCDNNARVLAAVKHSGYNLQFASPRLQADATVVAWAAATEEVKQVTVKDVQMINMYCQHVLYGQAPPMRGGRISDDEWRETNKLRLLELTRKLSLTNAWRPEGLETPAWKAAAYFRVPHAMRDRLWPWRELHAGVLAELQRLGKMPSPPSDDERARLRRGIIARDSFKAALYPVLRETHPELSPPHKLREMICVVYGIWTELSADEQARWEGHA